MERGGYHLVDRGSLSIALALLLVTGCAASPPPHPSSTIAQVIADTRERYRQCPSYHDRGTVQIDSGGKSVTSITFQTKRPAKGPFEFSFATTSAASSAERSKVITGLSASPTLRSELIAGRGASGGTSTRVPGVLLGGDLAEYSIIEWPIDRWAEARVTDCCTILVSMPIEHDRVSEVGWYWIDSKTHLLVGSLNEIVVNGQRQSSVRTYYSPACD